MLAIRQVKTVFVIFVAFVCCWSPYIIVLLYDSSDSLPLSVHLYASMLAHLHASLDFTIYGLMNRNVCPASASRLLGCCRTTSSSPDTCDIQQPNGREAEYNRTAYTNRTLVVEYYQLQDIDAVA